MTRLLSHHPSLAEASMKLLLKLIPWFFVALFAAEIVAVMLPKKDGEYHVREFGRLPVLLNGRIQPFDSVARNSLLQIRSTGDVPLEEVPSWKFWHHPKKLKSTEWLLEVMTRPEIADTRPIFLIHHAELIGELKLQDKGVEKSGLRYYTFSALEPLLTEINEQARKAGEVKPEEQTAFQKQVGKLANALSLYQRLKATLQPEGEDDFAQQLADFQKNLGPAQAAAQASESGKDFDKAALQRIAGPLQAFQLMARFGYPLVIPPLTPTETRNNWQTMGTSLLDSTHAGQLHPAVTNFAAMATAYHQQKPEAFNRAVAAYRQWLSPSFDRELNKGQAEFYFNSVKPFLHAMIIYLCAFVLAWTALLTFTLTPNLSESLRRSAFYLVILAGLVHTFGLVFRMALEGRPPVTNLYSSAIFIGWGTMVLGLVLEKIYRIGIGSIVGSLTGFVTLMIAHNLALGGDTMEMLRAVLDTNFWLATHVVVITLGYASTFAAGLLAILYIFLGVFTPLLTQKLDAGARMSSSAARPTVNSSEPSRLATTPSVTLPVRGGEGWGEGERAARLRSAGGDPGSERTVGDALGTMVYGIICFATLFSFVGTVLGGIWADQSWGRFWGWDPKENGALLIVIWNAIILHVRWGDLMRDRGIMNLVVFGNIVTSFSWFGVNMLGIGLHSYGFMDAAFKWLLVFIAIQVSFIAMSMAAGSMERVDQRQGAVDGSQRIGGWLILLAIGLPLGVISGVIGIFAQAGIFAPISAYSAYGVICLLVDAGFLGWRLELTSRFFKKKRSLPQGLVRFLIWQAVVSFLLFVGGLVAFGFRRASEAMWLLISSNFVFAVAAVAAAAIWGAYFRASKRVKTTFVK